MPYREDFHPAWYRDGSPLFLIALFIFLATALAFCEDWVRIEVRPYVVLEGGSVWVRCTVPRHPDNALLRVQVDGYTASDVELHGDDAPVTTERIFEHVPCEAESITCLVTRRSGVTRGAQQRLKVAGCDAGAEARKLQ